MGCVCSAGSESASDLRYGKIYCVNSKQGIYTPITRDRSSHTRPTARKRREGSNSSEYEGEATDKNSRTSGVDQKSGKDPHCKPGQNQCSCDKKEKPDQSCGPAKEAAVSGPPCLKQTDEKDDSKSEHQQFRGR